MDSNCGNAKEVGILDRTINILEQLSNLEGILEGKFQRTSRPEGTNEGKGVSDNILDDIRDNVELISTKISDTEGFLRSKVINKL